MNWINPKKLSNKESQRIKSLKIPGVTELPVLEFLCRRGFKSEEEIVEFIFPERQRLIGAIDSLHGCREAGEKILEAIESEKQIIIYGDYDVDGVCATAILWRYLYWELEHKKVLPLVPNRYTDGYGVNPDKLRESLTDEPTLLVTVDCGIKDADLLAELQREYPALEVVITDHHIIPETERDKLANFTVVHPDWDENFPQPEICAGAVAWFMTMAMAESHPTSEPNRQEMLELAGLATICDQMPLTGLNRDIVSLGLERLQTSEIPGIKALCSVAGVEQSELETYHLGFVIGPRLNAAGRMTDAITAVKTLCTNSASNALELARELDTLNQERQTEMQEAIVIAETQGIIPGQKLIFMHYAAWKEGVVGLIAGKLQEKYKLPTLIATKNHDGLWVGSARSLPRVNVVELISSQQALLEKYGGHAQAAGFTVTEENLEEFKAKLVETANKLPEELFTTDLNIDLEISPTELKYSLVDEFRLLAPYGQSFPAPRILLAGVEVGRIRQFGKDNEHLVIVPKSSDGASNENYELIWFRHGLEDISILYEANSEFVGSLGYNVWQGKKTIQFKIKYWRDKNESKTGK